MYSFLNFNFMTYTLTLLLYDYHLIFTSYMALTNVFLFKSMFCKFGLISAVVGKIPTSV